MIEIRVNNGVIEYRHKLDINWDNGVVRKALAWSEWRKANIVGGGPGFFRSPMHGANGDVIWFDEAADINTVDWQKMVKDIGPKDKPMTATEVRERSGLTPEYWAAMAGACAGKGDGMQAADNWRRAYEKAVQNMRSQARRHSDELQAERKKVEQRDRQVRVVSAEGDAMAKHIDELKGKLRDAQIRVGDALIDLDKVRDDNRTLTNRHHDCAGQLRAAQSELKAAREERDRVQVENRSLHDALIHLQGRRIAERTLLLRALSAFRVRHGDYALSRKATDELVDEIDAALKG